MIFPIAQCTFKNAPDDFIVQEHLPKALLDTLAPEPHKDLEHLWLYIQKSNINTEYVVRLLSLWFAVPQKDIGYSGLKDRHATTYQWFSVRLPKKPTEGFVSFAQTHLQPGERLHVLKQYWHNKKLKHKTHQYNAFCIILKDIVFAPNHNPSSTDDFLRTLPQTGVCNYFGKQRFGAQDQNIQKAAAYFRKILQHKNPKIHPKDAFWISVARSVLFNAILQKRVQDNTWNRAIDGDVFNLDGSGSVFVADIDDTIQQRIQIGDIHPTAPLYGVQPSPQTSHAAKNIEDSVLHHPDFALWTQGLQHLQIKQQRRALRVLLRDFSSTWIDDTTLDLRFVLPAGAFASSVIAHFVQNPKDQSTHSAINSLAYE